MLSKELAELETRLTEIIELNTGLSREATRNLRTDLRNARVHAMRLERLVEGQAGLTHEHLASGKVEIFPVIPRPIPAPDDGGHAA